MSELPAPVSVTDEYLAAVHTELVGLRADLAATRGGEVTPEPGQPIELTEPTPAPRARKRTI